MHKAGVRLDEVEAVAGVHGRGDVPGDRTRPGPHFEDGVRRRGADAAQRAGEFAGQGTGAGCDGARRAPVEAVLAGELVGERERVLCA